VTVNLTALAEARAKMTPGEYELHDGDDALRIVTSAPNRSALIATMEDDYEQEDDGPGLIATHNAADVLIEVARAAKNRDALFDVWRSVTTGHAPTTTDERRVIHLCFEDAVARYDIALAKVTL
jgi:hypothetical protein